MMFWTDVTVVITVRLTSINKRARRHFKRTVHTMRQSATITTQFFDVTDY